jgi:tRNA-modifying protein YgfZ
VAARLARYVLRAKVRITDDSAQWQILGFQASPPAVPVGALSLPYGSSRHLVLIPRSGETLDSSDASGTREDWTACDIAEGLPQVYLATSEAFVAQMLNLDVTGGIALDKGCYTGQEIIARAHYRGHVKRRMQHFVSEVPCALAPGDAGVLGDGRSFRVVEAVQIAAGRCEFLAVANPPQTDDKADSSAVAVDTEAETQAIISARQVALPYPLPGAQR